MFVFVCVPKVFKNVFFFNFLILFFLTSKTKIDGKKLATLEHRAGCCSLCGDTFSVNALGAKSGFSSSSSGCCLGDSAFELFSAVRPGLDGDGKKTTPSESDEEDLFDSPKFNYRKFATILGPPFVSGMQGCCSCCSADVYDVTSVGMETTPEEEQIVAVQPFGDIGRIERKESSNACCPATMGSMALTLSTDMFSKLSPEQKLLLIGSVVQMDRSLYGDAGEACGWDACAGPYGSCCHVRMFGCMLPCVSFFSGGEGPFFI